MNREKEADWYLKRSKKAIDKSGKLNERAKKLINRMDMLDAEAKLFIEKADELLRELSEEFHNHQTINRKDKENQ